MVTSTLNWQALLDPKTYAQLLAVERSLASGETALEAGHRLRRKGMNGATAAMLLSQAELRRKAQAKFGDSASAMLFTPAGLEQASRSSVARLHASRFAATDCHTVADLGCGIASESIALVSAGLDVLAVEIDELTAQIAAHNLQATHPQHSSAKARVLTADATDDELADIDGVFLDPARRTAGHRDTKRLASANDYSPSLEFAFGLAEQLPTGIKLGPGFDRDLIPDSAEAQWVSVDGQVVETGLWFGSVAREGVKRSALIVHSASSTTHELTATADAEDAEERPLGAYLYEPDGAVIRARLIGMLATGLQAGMLSEGIAYLTGDTLVDTPFATAFRVLEQLPASEKQLKRALAARDIGTLEIKKRGASVDPATLRKRLALKGSRPATLVLTRVAGKHVALLVERV